MASKNQPAAKSAVVRRTLIDLPISPLTASPAAAAASAQIDVDDLVQVSVPKGFTLTLDDHQPVAVNAGVQMMPRYMAQHWWAKAQGVEEFTPPVTGA